MDARTRLLLGRAEIAGRQQQPPPQQAITPTTCCEPCREQNFCREDANCCLECHFSYEEQLAFLYIPEEGRQILREQHAWLIANGFPHEELEAHAQYEMECVRPYCPPEIVAQIEADHVEYKNGHLHSRDARSAPTTPMPMEPLAVSCPLLHQRGPTRRR